LKIALESRADFAESTAEPRFFQPRKITMPTAHEKSANISETQSRRPLESAGPSAARRQYETRTRPALKNHTRDSSRLPANSFFAVEPGAAPANPFPGTRIVTLAQAGTDSVGLEVFAAPGAKVETYVDAESGACVYFWGLGGHPEVPRANLLQWILQRVNAGEQSALTQVVGLYVILIDDRKNHRVKMIADHMGLRPWFVGQSKGRLVCGSDVWAIADSGFDTGGINYDAVASWLRYNYDCTGQSLFAGFSQLGFTSIGTWENGKYSEAPYAIFTGGDNKPPTAEIVERIHHDMTRTFDAIARDLDHVSIALSGGYDSRYLAALASKRKHLKVEAFSVRDREAEGIAATMVAEGLGLSLQVLRTDGTIWNMYDEPFHFTPGGFPMTKQLSHFAASQRPGVPCLNGFIGDPVVRGTIDRAEAKLEREHTDDLAVVFQRIHRVKHIDARFDLLDPAIVKRADERTLNVWRRQMAKWTHTGHPFVTTNLFVRQRHYLANNFLQHMDVAEAIVPFTSFDLLQYKFQNDPTAYTFQTYEALFKAFYPEIAQVPHNSKMGSKNDLHPIPSRCEKQWATAVMRGLSRSNCLTLVSRKKSIPRLIGALMGRRDVDVVPRFLNRLLLLDQRLNRAGIAFDWNAI
jgi:hypothetical protein